MENHMKRWSRLLALLVLLGFGLPTWAATTTTTFSVTANVAPTCSIAAAALDFGAAIPNPINSNVDSQTTITATCSNGAPYQIALSAGNGLGATFGDRRMTSGTNLLRYSLFTDSSRTIVWGNGSAGNTRVNGNGNGAAQTITVYGRIISGQSVATGMYSDTVVVTMTF